LPLCSDPDRYAIALLDAMLALQLGTEHACAVGIAAQLVGVEGNTERLSADGRYIITNWERYRTRAGAIAGTLEGRVATLREKRRRYQSTADVHWRTVMGAAFQAVLADLPSIKAKEIALLAAGMVEETEFARNTLFPMIDARISG
jgi:hypothetical protein